MAACPGPSRWAPGWADARLRGVLELQQWLHQAEQTPKQMRKSNLGSGWPRKQMEIPGHSLNADTKEKPTPSGSLARHEEAKSICCSTGCAAERTQHLPLPKIWHRHPQAPQPASSRSAPNRNGWQLVFSQAFGTSGAKASFYFIVPMISLVNCNQQNSSRCASEGRSRPGGSERARLSWLRVSQRAFETICISKLLRSGKLLFF